MSGYYGLKIIYWGMELETHSFTAQFLKKNAKVIRPNKGMYQSGTYLIQFKSLDVFIYELTWEFILITYI